MSTPIQSHYLKTGHNSQWLKLTEKKKLMVNIFSSGTLSSTNTFSDQSNDWSMKRCLLTVGCHQWNHLPLLTNTWRDLLLAGDAFSMIKSFLKVTRRLKMLFHSLDLSANFFNVTFNDSSFLIPYQSKYSVIDKLNVIISIFCFKKTVNVVK